jgi:tetratricopeptide (TPR) repeat protein
MRHLIRSFSFACLGALVAIAAQAESGITWIKVLDLKDRPIRRVRIIAEDYGFSALTDDRGLAGFKIVPQGAAGYSVRLKVSGGNYVFASPWRGRVYIPPFKGYLGLALFESGQYTEAAPFLSRALKITEISLGADHPNTAAILNNLGHVYRSQGKYAEAEPLFKRALAIREKALGADHLDTAISLNNLVLLRYSQGKYADAEPLSKRVVAIREKALGADNLDIVIDLYSLAEIYRAQGKYSEAEPLYKRALEIDERILGAGHPEVASVLENYANLLRKMNREAEAIKLETRAKEIRAKAGNK